MSDAELLSLVLSGNTARFEALVDRYLPSTGDLCREAPQTQYVTPLWPAPVPHGEFYNGESYTRVAKNFGGSRLVTHFAW